MAKVIILNVGTEHRFPGEREVGRDVTMTCLRHAWFARPGDVIVSPVPMPQELMDYIGSVLGFDASTVSVVSRPRLLDDEVLVSPDLLEEIRSHLAGTSSWRLLPCFASIGVTDLAEELGVALAGAAFFRQRGMELFNRKSHFRQLAAGLDLPIAPGAVVASAPRLGPSIERLLAETGTVILKSDDGAGGFGNVALSLKEADVLPGCRETIHASDIAGLSASLWDDLSSGGRKPVTVEAYYSTTHQCYFEYEVGPDGWARFVDGGNIRLRRDTDPRTRSLVWVGLDLPLDLPLAALTVTSGAAGRLADAVARLGYRGFLNVDAVRADGGEVLLNEINARWGGGLVLHSVAAALLGDDYADRAAVSSLRDVPGTGLDAAVSRLRQSGLAFSHATGEGVVVLGAGPDAGPTTEMLVLAGTRARTRELEATTRSVFEAGVTPP